MALNTKIEIITQEKCADKVVNALKALVKTALYNGFSKTSYNKLAYLEKIEKIHAKYQNVVLFRFEDLYTLYYQLSKELPNRRKITSTEADDNLAELLI